MKEIPILFSTMMVHANLEDRKSMTRRIVKFRNKRWRLSYEANDPGQIDLDAFGVLNEHGNLIEIEEGQPATLKELQLCPYGHPGDLLWVRETWQWIEGFAGSGYYVFKTDFRQRYGGWERDCKGHIERIERWRPSIFMPKEAARIWLQVTDIRVERLQDISEEDAIKEGVKPAHCDSNENCPSLLCKEKCSAIGDWWNYRAPDGEGFPAFSARSSFESLWESINGADSWQANPWTWVISFKVLSTTGKPDLNIL